MENSEAQPVGTVDTMTAMLSLAAYFRRTADLWEGPDGAGTEGTQLCLEVSERLQKLAGTPMALGLARVRPFPTFQRRSDAPPENDIWTTKDGRRIPVHELEANHMRAILRMILRRKAARIAAKKNLKARLEEGFQALQQNLQEQLDEEAAWGEGADA